jgi:NADPH:quinone reductase
MKALVLEANLMDPKAAVRSLRIVDKPVPEPKHGQVLVKIEAAPCNPSDILSLQGLYGVPKKLPSVPGWEGCGTVVATGGGFLSRRLLGKRVACGLQTDADGTWAEFFVAEATACIPIKAGMPVEQAAGLVINPFSAVGLVDCLQSKGLNGFVHTAGLSQVGRMLLGLEKRESLVGIHMVRRLNQVDSMRALGAKHVLSFESPSWPEALSQLCKQHQIRGAFDAVGGDVTGKLMGALPPKSTVWVYGALSLAPCSDINPLDLIFKDKKMQGFYLGTWLGTKNIFQLISTGNRVQNLIRDGVFETQVRAKASLEDAPKHLLEYLDNMTAGKVLICPN